MTNVVVGNKRSGARGIYVGRPSPLGNPFFMHDESQRDACCDEYEQWLTAKIAAKDRAVCAELNAIYQRAKNEQITLVCWCAPRRCHADFIARLINEKLEARK